MNEEKLKEKLLGETIVNVTYNPLTEYGFEHFSIITSNGVMITVAVDPNSDKSNLSII